MTHTLAHLGLPNWKAFETALEADRNVTFNGERVTVTLHASPPAKPSGPLPYHRHEEEQIIYMLEGNLDVLLAEGRVRLAAGDIIAIAPNAFHGAERVDDGPMLMINIFSPRRSDQFSHAQLQTYDSIPEDE